MTIASGTRLGRYEIRAKIGAGGMGQVYLARDTSELDRTVAIKLLPPELASDARRMQRFVQEARTVSALNHPNVLTIFEFGQEGIVRFIAMEYVDGMTLREQLRTHHFKLHELLDIAIQVAAALDAAHEANVAHRDIKPENIMVRRRDHIVKVLDFGLAKPLEVLDQVDTEAGTQFKVHTEPGVMLGTAAYMSPEQSEAPSLVNHRTDIWSLGVVLYEMITGHLPFKGKDVHRQIIAIQEEDPPPLSRFNPAVPDRLEYIVRKALAKDANERYQTAKDLLIDLRNLRRKLEVDAEIDRTLDPETRAKTQNRTLPSTSSSTATTVITTHQTVSSAEYVFNQVKLHKRSVFAIIGLLLVVGAVSSFLYLKRTRTALLTDKDTILLTEFDNKTGDSVFDGTLRQGLTVQLQQSPFLDIFSDQRVRNTLRLMSRSPDERVTADVAREICQRQGLKAYIAGSIAKFDRNYSLTLEALNGQTGEPLAIVQVEAEGKDQVLKALSRAASELREKLGESLSSIEKFDAPLEVTTSSLDALQEYALGQNEQSKGQYLKAIEFFRRATEKDPNFASAWGLLAVQYNNTQQPALAAEYAAKAFELRDRVSQDEQARITFFYYSFVTGELDKAIEVQEAYVRNYPRDARGPGNLATRYLQMGQTEKAITATQEALRLNPNSASWHGNLAAHLIRVNHYSESAELLQRALAQKLDGFSIRQSLYTLAFLNGDTNAMHEQTAWASGKPDEHQAFNWQVQSASFSGEWNKAQELLQRAIDIATRADAKENASSYSANQALSAAWLGKSAQAVTLADASLKIERNRPNLTTAALALALAGETEKAHAIIQELEQKYPKDTRVNQLWLPEIKAAIALHSGEAQSALDLLESARAFEPVDAFWQKTLRTMAYLKLGKGSEAVAESQKIIEHRGEGPLSLLWPLAHLNLARGLALQGDGTQARKTYEDFFKLWANADADLPKLIEAKKEYDRLK